jgi:hypothetical protein
MNRIMAGLPILLFPRSTLALSPLLFQNSEENASGNTLYVSFWVQVVLFDVARGDHARSRAFPPKAVFLLSWIDPSRLVRLVKQFG